MTRSLSIAVGFVGLSVCWCAPAHADAIAYTNFPVNNNTVTYSAYNGGYTIGSSATPGLEFESSMGGAISQIYASIYGVSAPTLSLYQDESNEVGALLGTFGATSLGTDAPPSPGYGSITPAIFAPVNPGDSPILTGNTSYWLVASGGSATWSQVYPSTTGSFYNGSEYNSSPLPGVEVLVAPASVPEPSASVACIGCLLTGAFVAFARWGRCVRAGSAGGSGRLV